MAVNNTQNNYAKMEFPLTIKRQDAFSIDPTEIWPSLAAAQEYAKTNPTAYVGQKLAVVVDGVSTQYQIKNEAGELEPLGGVVESATDEEVKEMFNEVFGSAESGT
jgi:hypothetical protein